MTSHVYLSGTSILQFKYVDQINFWDFKHYVEIEISTCVIEHIGFS
jgi:hypothetical protein